MQPRFVSGPRRGVLIHQHFVVFGPAPMQSSGAGSFDGRTGVALARSWRVPGLCHDTKRHSHKTASTRPGRRGGLFGDHHEESRHQHSADDGLGISLASRT
jgi:hypothetical protein